MTDEEEPMEPGTSGVSRRALLGAGAGVPLGVVLAGCGGGDPATSPTTEPGPEEPGDGSLAAVADIPVGGALVVTEGPDGKPVVLARPREDEVVAFSAICTHKGCTVGVEGSSLVCPCHGSTFDLTGANTAGPAPAPLPPVEVTVTGGQVRPA